MCRCNCKHEDSHGNCKIKHGMPPCEDELPKKDEAIFIVNGLVKQGFSLSEIKDVFCDGEWLLKIGFTNDDELLVEEIFNTIEEEENDNTTISCKESILNNRRK